MTIEFDPGKAAANRKKHGVSFAEADAVLNDPLALPVRMAMQNMRRGL